MKTLLQRLETSDGYLRDVTLEFAEGLTCIIGARGTCKSTVVETIRFAHDLDPGRIKMLTDTGGGGSVTRGPRGLLRETIAGGTASCMIAMVDERGGTSKLRIERSIGTRGPRAYRDDVVDPEFSTHEVPIEIYSQGDLLAIAEDPEARLQLIDRPHIQQIAEIKTRLRDGQGQIEVLGGQIVKLRASIREDERGLAPQSELQQQLDVLARDRPTLDPRLEQERSEYEERERLAAKVRAYCQAFAQLFPSPRLESPPEQEVLAIEKELRASKIESAQSLADHLRQLADTAVVLERRLADAHELVAQTRPCVAALNAEFEERNERYRTLRREEEALSDALEREDRLRAQLRRIGRLRDDLELRMTRLESLLSSRREARREVEACLDEIFALRLQQIEQISTDLGHDISLDLVQSVQCGTYVEAIADLLQGTRLKRQRDIATRIVDLISPAELVDLIEAEEVDRLGELANLDSSQASRITNHFVDNMPRVQALEALVFEDQSPVARWPPRCSRWYCVMLTFPSFSTSPRTISTTVSSSMSWLPESADSNKRVSWFLLPTMPIFRSWVKLIVSS